MIPVITQSAARRWLPLGRRGAFHANCYAPQKYVKRWSWEIYWMAQAVVVLAAVAYHRRAG